MSRQSLRGAWKWLFNSRKTANRPLGKSANVRCLRGEMLEPRDLFAYAPDPGFAGIGGVIARFGSNDQATAVAVQSDGKLLVAGNEGSANGSDFIVLRYLSDGTADTTFNNNGGTAVSFASNLNFVGGIGLQSDGNILVAGTAQVSDSNYDFAATRILTTNGHVDTTYGSSGLKTTEIGGLFDVATALAVQADNKMIVVGYSQTATDVQLVVARFGTNGSLDTTFNGTGIAKFGVASKSEYAVGVAIQTDGKIVVAGNAVGADEVTHPLILRYNTNGTLDNSFDSDGSTQLAFNAAATGMDLQSDGKIVLAATTATGTRSDMSAIRLLTTGALDTTFSGDGLATIDAGSPNDAATSVVVQASGRIVVAGSQTIKGNSNFALVGFTSNGQADTSFGTDGRVVTSLGSDIDTATAIIELSSTALVVVGQAELNGSAAIAVVQYADIAPSITSYAVPATGKEGATVTLQATAQDPAQQSGTLDYRWVVTGPGNFRKVLHGSSANLKLPDNGTFSVTLTVTNDSGFSAQKKSKITVTNVAPKITFFSAPSSVRVNTSIAFKAKATDPAGAKDTLTYTWVITGANGFKKTLHGANANWTPTRTGKYTVTLTVKDDDGGKATRKATIRVGA